MSKRKRDDVDLVCAALEPRQTLTFDAMVAQNPSTWQPTTDFSELVQCLGRSQPKIDAGEEYIAHSVETVTREYEESFLCEPNAHVFERPCVNGAQCESMRMGGFVLREFLLPSHGGEAQASDRPQRTCLMCARMDALRLHLQNNTRVAYGEPIINVTYQDHSNLVCVEEEYLKQDCIVPNGKNAYTGLVAPIVVHSRSAYKQHKVDGLRGWKQCGYAKSRGNEEQDMKEMNHFLWRRGALASQVSRSPELAS